MFNEVKNTMLAVEFLRKTKDKRMSYLKLMKLMYLADRNMLEKHNKRISYDVYYNMKNGVVLSNTLNAMQEEIKEDGDDLSFWDLYIKKDGYDSVLFDDEYILEDALLKEEKEIIDELYKKHLNFDKWEMVDIIHDLPEWEHPKYKGEKSTALLLDTINEYLEKQEISKEYINLFEFIHKTPYAKIFEV